MIDLPRLEVAASNGQFQLDHGMPLMPSVAHDLLAAALAVLDGQDLMVCPTHRSPWYEDEGLCQRAAAATAWKEDDTMWQDCGDVVKRRLVPLEETE